MLEEVTMRSLNLFQLILFLIYPQEMSHNTFLFNILRRGTNAGYQVNINELNKQKYIQLKNLVILQIFDFNFFFNNSHRACSRAHHILEFSASRE